MLLLYDFSPVSTDQNIGRVVDTLYRFMDPENKGKSYLMIHLVLEMCFICVVVHLS